MSAPRFRHAVVAGASMAGLLAARALADHFEQVTLVEKDVVGREPTPRKGVPQGRHVHLLLAGGLLVLDRLFPQLSQELIDSGAVVIEGGRNIAWNHCGHWRLSDDAELVMLSMTRPLLESAVAKRLCSCTNIQLREATRVVGLVGNPSSGISGVYVAPTNESKQREQIIADLIIDGTGRGSATPTWLEELGFERPTTEEIPARVTYATATFRRPEGWSNWRALVIGGAPARRGGSMLPIERDRWLVSLAGYFDEHMPKDHPEFFAFARSLPVPDLYNAVMPQQPVSEVVRHGFPGSRRQRYDRLKRVPERLIVLGDALCCFNPVYGQGITVSALEAEQLGATVAAAKTNGSLGELTAEWFARIRPIVDSAWEGIWIEDSRFPELSSGRSLRLKASQWYVDRLHRATYRDFRVTDQFYRVLSFIDPPSSLFNPRVALSALFARGPAKQDHGAVLSADGPTRSKTL